jgi:uncharacterized damage-inducible protein DinB
MSLLLIFMLNTKTTRMKKLLVFFLLAAALSADCQQKKAPATLRSILLEQFQTTWNQEDWFVPISISLEGLTAKQAMWKPCDSCHSVGQLAYHLLYWNKEQLDKFNGTKRPPNPDNNETFTRFTEASWTATVHELNQVMKEWETVIKNTDEAKLQSWYSVIAHISAHNAYHTGQILYVRKLAGNWDPKKGVR